jgi:predicted CXXCH cytochrome family protein
MADFQPIISQKKGGVQMKKALILAVALVLMAASVSFAVIAGSRHDLTSGTYYSGAQVSACQFCHTPHLRNNTVVQGAPLWNRQLPTATYTLYGNGQTISGTSVGQPGTNSKTCLSCHDGTIALGDILVGNDSTIQGAGGGTTATIVNGKLADGVTNPTTGRVPGIGTDLRQEHPVGVVYDSSTQGPGLNSSVNSNAPYNIGNKKWRLYGGGDGTGTVECASCHDPHNTTNGEQPFLRDSYSTICTDCHSQK